MHSSPTTWNFPLSLFCVCLCGCVQSHACYNICAHVKNPSALATTPLCGHLKMHALVGMGNAILAAAVPHPGMATLQRTMKY